MRFAFIARHRRHWPIDLMCRVLQVSRSGYYAWRRRPMSAHQSRRLELSAAIRQAHQESRCLYGSPRIHRELLARGIRVCVNTVAKLMKMLRLFSRRKRKFRTTTNSRHSHPVASNVLNRSFTETQLNRTWASDITFIPTLEGWLYLSVVLDLCSRKVVGFSMQDHLRSELATEALTMAIQHRRPGRGLLHHSDRGVQYAGDDYQHLLSTHGFACSMSRPGDCWDNAPVESFMGTLKTELVHHEHYATREEAKQSIFEYIECYYNRRRRHSALNYLSPDEYERRLVA